MKLLSLSLRGAIGTHKGLGVDEIAIDFDHFEDGIIAFVGENGRGKSTILENCHPFRTLASRNGALQNHFRLRDSHRILRFELAGHVYESKLLIDAQTGKQESYLYRDGEPLTDGKTTTYDAAVASLFGCEELFFRSMFRAQNAAPFASLTAGKRKEMFVELLGLGALDTYHASAKARLADAQAVLERTRSTMAVHAEKSARLSDLAHGVEHAEDLAHTCANNVLAAEAAVDEARASISTLEREAEATAALVAQHTEAEAERMRAEKSVDACIADRFRHDQEHRAAVADIRKGMERHEKIMGNAETIRAKVAEMERLAGEITEHDALRNRLEDVRVRTLVDVTRAETDLSEVQQRLAAARTTYQHASNAAKSRRDMIARDADNLQRRIADEERRAELMCGVPCSSHPEMQSACQLLADAREATERLARLRADADEVDVLAKDFAPEHEADTALKLVAELEDALASARAGVDAAERVRAETMKAVGYDAAAHDLALRDLAALKAEKWDSIAGELATAHELIDHATGNINRLEAAHISRMREDDDRIAEAKSRLRIATERAESLAGRIASSVDAPARLDTARRELAAAEGRLGAERTELEAARRDIARIEAQLAEAEAAQEEWARLDAIARTQDVTVQEWTFIVKATGRDGIQALELDAAGPNVSAIANDLLRDAYGSEYQVAFETMRSSADGKKQIESFEIAITDPDGKRGKIEDLSGGQKVWIEAAISQAIAIYLRRKGAHDLRTSFLDEADGALDAENAFRYLTMLRRSHDVAGTHHTLLITHRQELLSLIPQQIRLVPGEGIVYA